MKTKIIATGMNGLVGSKFKAQYADRYEIISLGRSVHDASDRAVDVTDLAALEEVVQVETDATAILHLAAYTDVTGAYEQTGDKTGPAYQVNVTGTKNIAEMAASYNKHLVLVSTAYVFDGEKDGLYTEVDQAKPIEWYGQTKLWSEEAVQESGAKYSILRIDQPFRSDEFAKVDTAHRIINGIKNGALYPQFNNHYFGPTYIDDFAKVIDWTIRAQAEGLWHASSGEKWSDYDFANLINSLCHLGGEISAGDLDAYLEKTVRPYQRNTAMSNEKLKAAIDFELKTVEQAITEVAANL